MHPRTRRWFNYQRAAARGGTTRNSPSADAPKGDSPSILRGARRDIAVLGVGNVGAMIAQLVLRATLVASLLRADYGRLSLVLGIYNTAWAIGATGLPTMVSKHIARITPREDRPIVHAAVRAMALPAAITAAAVSAVAAVLLNSLSAGLCAFIGLTSLIYSLLTLGVLRGRGQIGRAALVLLTPSTATAVALLALVGAGVQMTPTLAFFAFTGSNVLGLAAGVIALSSSHRDVTSSPASSGSIDVPTPRQLLGPSIWLSASTVAVQLLPLVLRAAVALDSYAVVALVDVALILFILPQRLGAIVVAAVVPHATRALDAGRGRATVSVREHAAICLPFAVAVVLVTTTPILHEAFAAIGRPAYDQAEPYLVAALLAGPPRVLYGVVEGVLTAHGDNRYLALATLAVTALASLGILLAVLLLDPEVAAAVFSASFWVVYLTALLRVRRLTTVVRAEPVPRTAM